MARRMFSPQIVGSDAFLDMPTSSRELYFQLGMFADDDGFVNPKRIMRMVGASEDDIKILLSKRFVLPFDNGVVVIKHWRVNNLVRKDWYRPTQYVEQKKMLFLKENGSYTEDYSQGQPLVNELGNVGKVRLGYITTPELRSGDEKKTMKKNSFNYSEGNSSDAYEDVVDLESGEVKKDTKSNLNVKNAEMLKWAEDRRGFKFLNIPKQLKAFKTARDNKIMPSELKNRWAEFEGDKFWKDKGFDWMDVLNNFNKKR